MLRSTKFNEDFADVLAISKYLANNEVQSMHHTLTTARINAVNTSSPSHQNQKSENSISDSSNVAQSLDLFLHAYCNKSLSTNATYGAPYQVASFLFKLKDPFKWKHHCISRHTLIMFLIKNSYVPVQHSALYCIVALYRDKCLCTDDSWSSLATPGNKPLLSHQGLYQLVNYVKDKTLGGASIPFFSGKEVSLRTNSI